MARKHEAVRLLKTGHTPTSIAREMGISVASVMGYLYNQVGEGRIRRSDIVFAIAPDVRRAIESAIPRVEAAGEGTKNAIWSGIPSVNESSKTHLSTSNSGMHVWLWETCTR